jgi:hypothetical protein
MHEWDRRRLVAARVIQAAGKRAGDVLALAPEEAAYRAGRGEVEVLGDAGTYDELVKLFGDQAEGVAGVVKALADAFTGAIAKTIVEVYRRNLLAPGRNHAERALGTSMPVKAGGSERMRHYLAAKCFCRGGVCTCPKP